MRHSNFNPKLGQIDFTNARYAPTFNSVLKNGSQILLVKRSRDVGFYPGTWNGISGFLDDNQSLEEKFIEEIKEELGLPKQAVKLLKIGKPFLQPATEYNKVWIVIPILAEVKPLKIKLNWEASEAKWYELSDIAKLKLMPGFERVLAEFF